ncbi:MAG: hypothetical protein KIC63_08350 [Clostridium sp.]|nr:hypothetical protein [Clostridium sp.]
METMKTPEICDLPQGLFTRAEFHEELSEETGFSNYSYWRSTFRTFFKSNVVKVVVILMLLLVAYTIIYPMVTDGTCRLLRSIRSARTALAAIFGRGFGSARARRCCSRLPWRCSRSASA